MGGCCGSFEFGEEYGSVFGPTDDGSQVLNSMIAELWPQMFDNLLKQTKEAPFDMGRYRLTVKDYHRKETLDDVPVIKRIKSNSKQTGGKAGGPAEFTARLVFKLDHPDLDLELTRDEENNGIFNFALPDVSVNVKQLLVDGTVNIVLSLVERTVKFYFLSTPKVHWDIEVDVTKLSIPLIGEDL